MSYRTIAHGPDRHFEITGGFQEGYDGPAAFHGLDELVAAHIEWQTTHKTILGARIYPVTISYAYPGVEDEICGAFETGWILDGTINVLYQADKADEDVLRELRSLAGHLGKRIGQTRVYLSYRDTAYILEQDHTTPCPSCGKPIPSTTPIVVGMLCHRCAALQGLP